MVAATQTRSRRRSGFTLLELMLALTISVLLLAGLFFAIDTQLREMEEGRTVLEESAVPRALLARMSSDLTSSLGPIVPASSSSSASTTATTGTTTPTDTAASSAAVLFQLGVKGDRDRVAVFRTRLSRALIAPPLDPSGNTPPPTADVWRLTFFLAGDRGLARQEIRQATADTVDDLPTDVDDNTRIIAENVKSVEFRYYDGTAWQDSWDGSTPGPDGKTPQGPPRAVELTLGIQQGGEVKTYKHVIAFPTAPGPASTQ